MLSDGITYARGSAFRMAAALIYTAICLTGCGSYSDAYRDQQVFASPTAAVVALNTAAQKGDAPALESIFGTEARETLTSGDPVADRRQREVFAVAMSSGWKLEATESGSRELIVGPEAWPFPIPLVKDRRGWWFDTAAGADEVLARRLGRNELATIGALKVYVIAQRQYAEESRGDKPSGVFAQQLRSDEGKRNGLYWPTADPTEPRSPLGDFAAAAAADGYGGSAEKGPVPFYGYFYRILSEQGPAAPGGAKNYVVGGNMTGGFAMIAFPAEYGNSGIMSFLVGTNGVIYESDLGDDTLAIGRAMKQYNPDDKWKVAE